MRFFTGNWRIFRNFLVLAVASTVLMGIFLFCSSTKELDIANKERNLEILFNLENSIQTKESKLQPPSTCASKNELAFLKVDQVDLSLYESNVSVQAKKKT